MHRKRQKGQSALMLLAVVAFGASAVHADETSRTTLSAGYDFSSGKYGTAATTDIATLALSAQHERGPWALRLSVPYLQVTGTGDVIASGRHGGRRTASTATTTRTTSSGLGDVVALVSYQLHSSDDSDSTVAVAGRVKFGTASEAMGTGQNDYAAQLHGYRAFGDIFFSILFGYEVLGSSAQLPLNNVYFGAAGGGYGFGERTRGGAEYKYAQQASDTAAEQRELTLYAIHQIRTDVSLRGYLLKGYADGSADSGYGLSVSVLY